MEEISSQMPKLPTSSEMRAWDRRAIEFGIPEEMLMENAGRAICACLAERYDCLAGMPVCLFMGGGNNGGDAACLARHLLDQDARPIVFHTGDLGQHKGACAWHVELARKAGVVFLPAREGDSPLAGSWVKRFSGLFGALPALVVDGLLGTGFHGALRPDLKEIIAAVNNFAELFRPDVVAIDIPSGLDSATGLPSPIAIKAGLTVTLQAAKPGLLLPAAGEWRGKLICRKIGMPKAVERECPASWHLLDGRILLSGDSFPQGSYKNVYGHVVVIGGAGPFSGAAHLAAAGALRAGAGLVTVCAPASSLAGAKSGWPEIMTMAAGALDQTSWPLEIVPDLAGLIGRADALVIGPGMGRSNESANFLRLLLDTQRPPTVFDADALWLLGHHPDWFQKITARDILTPHPGEAAAMLSSDPAMTAADRPGTLARLISLAPGAMVLKGAGTLLGQLCQPALLCPYDIPQLAIGGAGDTLSGCVAAIAARRENREKPALAIAAYGVIIHAIAGRILAKDFPERGGTASNLADCLAKAIPYVKSLPRGDLRGGALPWP